jgi:hypothetical protein
VVNISLKPDSNRVLSSSVRSARYRVTNAPLTTESTHRNVIVPRLTISTISDAHILVWTRPYFLPRLLAVLYSNKKSFKKRIMPVVVHAITVVVRCAAIEERYPGGMAAFEEDVPNNTFCTDGELANNSFMHPADVRQFIERLEGKGLKWLVNNMAQDFVVVDQHKGPCSICDWIHFGKQKGPVSFCWIGTEGPDGRRLIGPSWWKPEDSAKLNFIPNEEAANATITECGAGPPKEGMAFLGYSSRAFPPPPK